MRTNFFPRLLCLEMFKEDVQKIAIGGFSFLEVMDYCKEALVRTLEREIVTLKG